MTIRVSSELAAHCRKTPERAAWLARLPEVVKTLEHRWRLTLASPLDNEAPSCSYVSAVVTQNGTPAVLKVGMPHMESKHEVAGLRFWNGDPTVRILASDENLGAMVLERCRPRTTLRSLAEREQDIIMADLLHRLWRSPSAPHPFRALSALTEYWSGETLALARHWSDAGLTSEGLRLFKELPRNATREVLLATDLHAGNVLRAEREPWVVIDPKPFVGDPAYDATQHLFNCWARLKSDPHETIRRFAGRLGIDHERDRLWTFARIAAEPRDDWTNDNQAELARAIAP